MKRYFLSALVVLCGCSYSNKWGKVNVKNEFTVDVPSWMDEKTDLKPGADFQYCNRFRNIYAVGFSAPKNGSLNDFYLKESQVLKNALTAPTLDDSTAGPISGRNAIHTELSGMMQGERIYYSVLAVEGDSKFYELCVWTRGEDRKLKYGADLNRLLGSFQLLH
ncbi:MAG: hypothetical protein U0T73_01040 [Chitinophagales bacterium]